MSIFDLVFLVVLLAVAIALIAALVAALRGRGRSALRIAGVCLAGLAIYVAIAIAASYAMPQRVLAIGAPWCFDDWCLEVEGVNRTPVADAVAYDVELRIFSTARRVSQRANGAWVNLIDQRGNLHGPAVGPAPVPLDVVLSPEESVRTAVVFYVSADAARLGLITGHGGSYCNVMSLLIIGQGGCLFGRPTMVRIL